MRVRLARFVSCRTGVLLVLCAGGAAGGCGTGDDDGHRGQEATARGVRSARPTWFTDITREVGLDFVHNAGAKGKFHMAEIMGAGAALFDFDADGDLDIYLPNGNTALPKIETVSDPINRLYRHEPDGRFVDVTAQSGLGDGGYGMGVAIGDIDNNGTVDVYVTNFGPDRLYRNRGDGTFEDITAAAGIKVNGWSCSATFFDYDLDGFLDLFITRYVEFNPLKACADGAGRPDYCGPKAMPPVHDILLHNNKDGTFTDVSEQSGIASVSAAGLGVISEDLNDDGWPDLYVANDAYANQMWINQRDGTFSDEAFITGTAYNVNGMAEAGMGVVAADLDNDLDLDLFMTHLGQETNTLYRNLGGAMGFSDVSGESGLGISSVPYTGFGVCAFDAELDGDLDVLVVNGRVVRGAGRADADVLAPWNLFAEPNLFYVNDGTGRFTLLDAAAGELCRRVEITRGLAIGDVDADGDLDVLMNNISGPARLYRNDAPRKGHFLTVRAVEPRLKRDAIGARVTVFFGERRLMRTISSGFSYLSASEPVAHFGLGTAAHVDRIEVRWADGAKERFGPSSADRQVRVVRGGGDGLQ